ncbi:carbamoyl-phosphate synthase, large subunit [Acidimicrobium ferrooxidans DSM 10331]|uniref:Carbamoyl phosphate synthase large chain n=1 Tax=Acidimicrobium ferrooxidans (strain DSM 10331 / JCM 15462 / NBRC 103882 / ICP) TaxID=525909 RepID=C7M0V7_ACIFD|nr:carbamoyl-phosphate synthase large subunit [Acidimicrobium ferrooxidans]ACU54615.1 carbamoyl-phosphate synthase, large subunit [Acidimicrobium ferrooxidans DSM 10331]
MPRDPKVESVLVIGSGPIVIGQASEFDYSGVQACRVLREEGLRVILANSNPATIMTDPEFADATYIEPLTLEVLERIIEAERPDAVLPTLGGQTALNLAMELDASGVLERSGVRMLGARPASIELAENRDAFRQLLMSIDEQLAVRGRLVRSLEEGRDVADELGYPLMLRPSYILGGAGTGIATDPSSFEAMLRAGLIASPVGEVLVEESIAGWKEFELEVMRDANDNCVVVCSIENVDPMGVHTGDSITVAPAQTLTDLEYQRMRSLSFEILRRVGVETGGSNVQFAVEPTSGRMVVVEMNPRVSRSSALASKATGFPIAKIATRLAIGYTLDEIMNDITGVTPASFEPALDYVVVKVPRWVFEKFEGAEGILGTRMQSVGETMAIGRSFAEALQKALRGIERSRGGFGADPAEVTWQAYSDDALATLVAVPTEQRVFAVGEALRRGWSIERVAELSRIDPWFIGEMAGIVARAADIRGRDLASLGADELLDLKRWGFSDLQLAWLLGVDETAVREHRHTVGVRAVYKAVDTCAGEFPARTPYYYGTYEEESETVGSNRPSVIIIGAGPNRIGQGIEFDYCCVHAAFALREAGVDAIMVNSNPETVSTDYDTSSRLYVEPLVTEHVLDVIAEEQRLGSLQGVIVSLGGQTPLKLARDIDPSLVLGTSPDSIDVAEDRRRWSALCERLGIRQPPGGTVTSLAEAEAVVAAIGLPVLVRPSYVLGGRAMEIVYSEDELRSAFSRLVDLAAEGAISQDRPILIDRFLEGAIEVDVDAVRDREGACWIGAVMEHVEEAGVHSGDSACTIPPVSLAPALVAEIEAQTRAIADALDVVGLINVQFAVADGTVFVIEANPRASRTVPFVAKATGVALVKIATRLMLGSTLRDLEREGLFVPRRVTSYVAVKEAVLPFGRFRGADSILGPEMRSTGEVMGIDRTMPMAFAKAQLAAGTRLPQQGTVLVTVADRDKEALVPIAERLVAHGFDLAATEGTASWLQAHGVPVARLVAKVTEEEDLGERAAPEGFVDAVRLVRSGEVALIINTPRGSGPRRDGYRIRTAALEAKIPLITTLEAARAAVAAVEALARQPLTVRPLQAYHEET